VILYVVRHAIAEARDPQRWPEDGKRPLTADGEERFRQAAAGLRRVVPHVDIVLASPYERAWRTAEILHDEAGWPVPQACEALRAERPPTDALAEIRAQEDGLAVAAVGHEPQLSSLVSLVLTGDPDGISLDFKKGGVARLDGATLRWVATPKLLRALR
jgi:phosphohistidine phosphatase